VIACAGALTIAPRILSLQARAQAQRDLANNQPRAAIVDATRSLDYNSSSVNGLVLRAAGFARLHAFAPARADLLHAIATEPQNWAMWALLGDLLTRRGELVAATSAYRRALALNPLDPGLAASVKTSGSAPTR
jgi:Flp pilus assembly protein TadD